jgi:hypothetical protein
VRFWRRGGKGRGGGDVCRLDGDPQIWIDCIVEEVFVIEIHDDVRWGIRRC